MAGCAWTALGRCCLHRLQAVSSLTQELKVRLSFCISSNLSPPSLVLSYGHHPRDLTNEKPRPNEKTAITVAITTEIVLIQGIANIEKLPIAIPPIPAPAANPSCTNELLRLRTILEASGARDTRLKFWVGPNVQTAISQSIRNIIVQITHSEMEDCSINARACTTIEQKIVRITPIRSARKPPNLDPIKLPMPNVRRITLILLSIVGITVARKGVMYVSTTEKPTNTKKVTPRVMAIRGCFRNANRRDSHIPFHHRNKFRH